MPRIEINENEEISLAAFDATENCALIPMLYVRTVDSSGELLEDSNIPGRKFTDAITLRNTYLAQGKVATVDGQYDRSYIMAYELLLQGMNVVIKPITYDNATLGSSINSDEAYNIIDSAIAEGALEEFKNRNIYNIKFITSGGYSNCGQSYIIDEEEGTTGVTNSYEQLRDLAVTRGDAIALVELREAYSSEEELFDSINNDFTVSGDNDNFVSICFPWCDNYTTAISRTRTLITMPGSFQYLMAYANSVKANANWLAASGVQRGEIPSFNAPKFEVGEALMHILQGDSDSGLSLNICVNPVYNAGAYGYRIWGNRVANKPGVEDLRFLNFLNVRILLCDLKKQLYHSAMRITFEPNDDIVWVSYKTLNNPLLDKMKSGRGIKFYNWIKETVTEKATLRAVLEIRPIEALENIEVNIVLTDEDASISVI